MGLVSILKKGLEKIRRPGHTQSLTKAISWRIVGTLDTLFISFFITGELVWALSIASVELFTKIILFYMHDRVWEFIRIRE
ncbi:MAG: DUF2061 domain-containing protein [Cyclobacteriaceae bacterium]|nr:DUF2061 domain-containing protein [Cyclobacteriaceae bacterium]